MSAWILFWKICFIVAVAVFGVMAIAVAIGGAVDVVRLLVRLKQLDEDD